MPVCVTVPCSFQWTTVSFWTCPNGISVLEKSQAQVCGLLCKLDLFFGSYCKKSLNFKVAWGWLCVSPLPSLQHLLRYRSPRPQPSPSAKGDKNEPLCLLHWSYGCSCDKETPTCKNSLSSTCPFLFRSTSFRISWRVFSAICTPML